MNAYLVLAPFALCGKVLVDESVRRPTLLGWPRMLTIVFTLTLVAGLAHTLPIRVRADDNSDLQEAFGKALAAEKNNDYAEAAKQLEVAVPLAKKLFGADHKATAAFTGKLALAYKNTERYDKAEPLYLESIRIFRKVAGEGSPFEFEQLNNLGLLYKAMNRNADAEERSKAALKICEALQGADHIDVTLPLDNLVEVYADAGRFEQAEASAKRSLQIKQAKLPANDPRIGRSQNKLGHIYRDEGKFTEAHQAYCDCLDVMQSKYGAMHPEVAIALNALGSLQIEIGQYQEAQRYYGRSLEIRKQMLGPEHAFVTVDMFKLGLINVLKRNPQDYAYAESLLKQVVERQRASSSPRDSIVGSALCHLGTLYCNMGRTEEASTSLNQALQFFEDKYGADSIRVADVLQEQILVYGKLGRMDDAEAAYRRCLQIHEAKIGKEDARLGRVKQQLGLARSACNRATGAADAFDQSRRADRGYVSRLLPTLSEQQQVQFMKFKDRPNLDEALSLSLSQPNDAAIAGRAANWLANGKAQVNESLAQRAMLGRGNRDPRVADLVAQLEKVRHRLALIANTEQKTGEGEERMRAVGQLRDQEAAVVVKLLQDSELSPAHWIEADEIRQSIPKGGVLIDILHFEPQAIGATKGAAAPQTPHYVAWASPAAGEGNVQVVDLGEAKPIDEAVDAFQKAFTLCQTPNPNDNIILKLGESEATQQLQAVLARISERTLKPLARILDDKKTVILSPDSNLWLVPWAALPVGENQFAVEKWSIRYTVAARDLLPRTTKLKPNPPRIFADPNFDLAADEIPAALASALAGEPPRKTADPSTLLAANLRPVSRNASSIGRVSPLPGTAVEALAIAPSIKVYAGEAKVYSSQQALEGVFKRLVSPRILVSATHGFFLNDSLVMYNKLIADAETFESVEDQAKIKTRDQNPLENPLLRCGVLLAGCNNRTKITDANVDDGILTGMEIIGTDLRATELVVLSACETGVGDVHDGEGVASLRQAFQLAGARAVIATLWKIPDEQSARLMNSFFANLSAGQGKSEALRNAQLKIINTRRERVGAAHPLFWAAFTLTGGD